ncbi:MAG: DUF308 domain-containing protein [Lachnospiraceae bacterium]|nr:DUF308 domain-containing protein [Lachnospiraceae bacterium]
MKKVLVMLLGIVLVIGGIFCLFRPVSTFLTTGYLVGVFILCDAIANIIAWFDAKKYMNISGWYLFDAIMSLIFGIIVVINGMMQFAVDMAIVYLVCAWVIVAGAFRISLALKIKRVNDKLPNVFKNSRWIWLMIAGILMILFAVICMMQPGIMSVILGTFISLTIIFNGATLITLGSYIPSRA